MKVKFQILNRFDYMEFTFNERKRNIEVYHNHTLLKCIVQEQQVHLDQDGS